MGSQGKTGRNEAVAMAVAVAVAGVAGTGLHRALATCCFRV